MPVCSGTFGRTTNAWPKSACEEIGEPPIVLRMALQVCLIACTFSLVNSTIGANVMYMAVFFGKRAKSH